MDGWMLLLLQVLLLLLLLLIFACSVEEQHNHANNCIKCRHRCVFWNKTPVFLSRFYFQINHFATTHLSALRHLRHFECSDKDLISHLNYRNWVSIISKCSQATLAAGGTELQAVVLFSHYSNRIMLAIILSFFHSLSYRHTIPSSDCRGSRPAKFPKAFQHCLLFLSQLNPSENNCRKEK